MSDYVQSLSGCENMFLTKKICFTSENTKFWVSDVKKKLLDSFSDKSFLYYYLEDEFKGLPRISILSDY